MGNKLFGFFCFGFCLFGMINAQDRDRGIYNDYRNWWNVTYYDLKVSVNLADSSIYGSNTIYFKPLESTYSNFLQIDLQEPMEVIDMTSDGKPVNFKKTGAVYLVESAQILPEKGLKVNFKGVPPQSSRPPWESGFVWAKDTQGNPWIASACQDLGASMWWPCKDHPKDEVDSMKITISCPRNLTAVSNGRLKEVNELENDQKSFVWKVQNPINNYGVNFSVGNYTYFKEEINGEKGPLDATYYVLPEAVNAAKKQFLDAPRTIEALEHWFGPYPFYEDGYKLVHVPYLGMEHQSCVTYGNGFQNGYLGRDLSGTGWGLKFDFIIVHESGHEWFANSVTNSNVADMWIHEGFTAYSEGLFLHYHFGAEAAAEYIRGTRNLIENDKPIIGNYQLGSSGSGDMYYKGSNMLHTLATMVNNDEKWRETLRKISATFYHKTVSSDTIEAFLARELKLELEAFFDVYLRDVIVPELSYEKKGKRLIVQFTNTPKNFKIPLRFRVDGTEKTLLVSRKKNKIKMERPDSKIETNPNYYIRYKAL